MPSRPHGKTVAEAMHPDAPEELVALAEAWCPDASERMLDTVWRGYDRLRQDPQVCAALTEATDDLERGITQLLELAIRNELTGDEPFDVQHGVPEGESRKNPPSRPREYDIAFIHYGNVRIMWPLEAKVMPPDRRLKDYIETIGDRYMTCEYAPFVPEGAMVGYVLRGDVQNLFQDIAGALGAALDTPSRWIDRRHRISTHIRTVPVGKPYPAGFRCHHLMMEFTQRN